MHRPDKLRARGPTLADETTEGEYEYRADVATLAAPMRLNDGTVVFEATLATDGDELRYPWGVEIATAAALSDQASLDALVGLPVLIEDHPATNQGHIVNGNTGGRKTVGTIVGARFDEASGQRIAQLAVHDPADQDRARKLGQVSEAYLAKVVDGEQINRRPNHVVIAKRGRAGSATIRTDTQEGLLDPDALAKLMTVLGGLQSAIETLAAKMDAGDSAKADEAEADKLAAAAELEKANADAQTAADEAKVKADAAMEVVKADAATEVKAAEDSVAERTDTLANEMVSLRADAVTLGVEIPAEAKTAAAIRTALALGLDCPAEDAKRADTAGAWIASRKAAPPATERDGFNSAGNGDGARADTTPALPC